MHHLQSRHISSDCSRWNNRISSDSLGSFSTFSLRSSSSTLQSSLMTSLFESIQRRGQSFIISLPRSGSKRIVGLQVSLLRKCLRHCKVPVLRSAHRPTSSRPGVRGGHQPTSPRLHLRSAQRPRLPSPGLCINSHPGLQRRLGMTHLSLSSSIVQTGYRS